MSTMHGGKGDRPRPIVVPRQQFDSNWDKIFGKKSQTTPDKTQSNKDKQ